MEAPRPPLHRRRDVQLFTLVFGLVGLALLSYIAIIKGETPVGGECVLDFECAPSHRGPTACDHRCHIICDPPCDRGEACMNGRCGLPAGSFDAF